ncbi:MAG: hypothetical protein NVSMB26_09170 [Beijerinckiaceae bacterium]
MKADFHRFAAAAQNIGDLFAEFGDLFSKEMRLARAELKNGLANLTQAAVLFAVAGLIALFAVFLLLVGIVHWIASFGLALHWSFMLVALVLLVGAAAAAYAGRAKATPSNLIPRRTLVQLSETAKTLKEQV